MATIQFKIDVNAGDIITANSDLTFEIYNYGSLFHIAGSVNSDDDVSIDGTVVTITGIVADENTTYMFTACSIDEKDNKGELSDAVMLSTDGFIVFTTISTSATWTADIINLGTILRWEVTGGVTIAETELNEPVFDMSGNTGTATVTIKSNTGFSGLTRISLEDNNILTVNNTLGTDLKFYEVKINTGLTAIDITTLTKLIAVAIRSNALTSVDLSYNTVLEELYIYDNQLTTINIDNNSLLKELSVNNNNLTSTSLDYIVNTLDSHGVFNGFLNILNNAGELTSSSYVSYNNLISKGWTIDALAPEENTPTGTPVLSDFYISNNEPTKVYFSSSEDITGLTTNGFVISGKNITSVDTTGLGGYFTVSTPFTFWDNNTIRLGENDATSHSQSILYNFTLTYITNNIDEPNASTYRYVTTAATGGGNGETEGTAWTTSEAITNMVAGMTIWFKSGDYGDIKTDFTEIGLIDSPVKWIGYKNTIGDITSNYYDNGVTYDTSEMPSFSNIGGTYYTFRFRNSKYIIFKNFQFKGGACNLDTYGNWDNGHLENINVIASTRPTGIVFFSDTDTSNLHHLRLKGCVVADHSTNNILLRGAGYNLIDNCKSYNTLTSGSPDYAIGIGGSNSILKDCYVESTVQPDSSIHGLYIRAAYWTACEYNLIVNSTTKNTQHSLDIRNTVASNNVIKGCTVIGNGATQRGGIAFNGAGDNNIVERCLIQDVRQGIEFYEDYGEGSDGTGIGTGNIVRNCIFDNISEGAIYTSGDSGNTVSYDDVKIYNNTFNNAAYMHSEGYAVTLTNFLLTNNIFNDVTGNGWSGGSASNFTFNYTDIWNSWATSIGTNSVNIDPDLVSATDFEPQATFTDIDAPKLTMGAYDYEGTERASTTTIGAIKHDDEKIIPRPNTPIINYRNMATFEIDLNGGDVETADVDLTYEIFGSADGYTTAIDTKGSATLDADVSVTTGVATLLNVDIGTETLFKVATIDENANSSLLSDAYSGAIAVLSNFNVTDAEPTKVYFDSSSSILGMTKTGFIISGYLNSEITLTVNGSNLTGHYFTLDTALTFWDNNTIRLGENDDTSHSQSIIYNFTLTYIENNINEPTTSNTYYVDVATGNDSDTGLTEALAWATLEKAASTAPANSTVWIKKGDYGNVQFLIDNNSGTSTQPIKFIGYKTNIGDITSNYFDYGVTMSTSEMPTLTRANSGDAMQLLENYIIVKNIQIQETGYGVRTSSSTSTANCVLENINIIVNDAGSGIGIGNSSTTTTTNNLRIKGCVVMNASVHNIAMYGNGHNTVLNTKVYNDRTTSLNSDYSISLLGSNNIVKDCYAEYIAGNNGNSHGIGVRAAGVTSQYNLIADNTALNYEEAFYVRNFGANHNVIKDNTSDIGNGTLGNNDIGGLCIWGEANYNIFERNLIENGDLGIKLYDNSEDGNASTSIGTGNIIRNNIFNNSDSFLLSYASNACDFTNNKIINNTINDCTVWWDNRDSNVTISGLEIENNIIEGVTSTGGSQSGMSFDYNNIHSSWATSIGTNSTNIDPNFVSATDFEPQESSLLSVPKLTMGAYDYEVTERASTTTIGAIVHVSEVGDVPSYTPTYYVSNAGDDTNDGLTIDTSWKTLTKVKNSGASAGDIIAFKKGDTFTGTIQTNLLQGSVGSPIILTSYGNGAKPIIDATTTNVDTWADMGSNIWKATLTNASLNRLKIDDVEVLGSQIEAELGTNVPDLVRFYYDEANTELSIYMPDDTNPDTHTIEYGLYNNGNYTFWFYSSDYITLDGLDIRGGNTSSIRLRDCDNIIIKNCDIGDMSKTPVVASDILNTNIYVHDNVVDANYSLDYSGSVQDTNLSENRGGGDGIDFQFVDGGEIYNNTVKNFGHVSIALSAQSGGEVKNIKVYNNDLSAPDIAYGGSMGWSGNIHDCEIYNNYIHDSYRGSQLNGYDNHIHHNVFENINTSPIKSWNVGSGFRLQGYNGAVYGNIFENNIFLNTEGAGISFSDNNTDNIYSNIFRNNIMYNCGTELSNYGLSFSGTSGTTSSDNNTFNNNLIYSSLTSDTVDYYGVVMTDATFNTQTSHSHTIQNNIEGNQDPDFTNPLSDWHLNTGSPAINTGTPALSTVDYYGETMNVTTPDIGISDNN